MAGTVSDQTGAVLPGTSIVLLNPSTGIKFTTTTDSKGYYRFLNVPPSQYTATFSHGGFSTVTVTSLALDRWDHAHNG